MIRTLLAAVFTLGAVFGIQAWNAHLVSKGDAQGAARVLAEWDAADLQAALGAERQALEAERKARAAEQLSQQQAERIAHEHAQREAALRADITRLESVNRGLRDAIAEQGARLVLDLSGADAHARTAALAHEAATAGELLGRCGERYSELGAEAEGLRLQVIGLQDWARGVPAAPPESTNDGF